MKATIKKHDPAKFSRNGDVRYIRIYFELDEGSWAATDLVPTYRNFSKWRPILASGIGTVIGGVGLKAEGKINADSDVYIVKKPLTPDPILLVKSSVPEPKKEPKKKTQKSELSFEELRKSFRPKFGDTLSIQIIKDLGKLDAEDNPEKIERMKSNLSYAIKQTL